MELNVTTDSDKIAQMFLNKVRTVTLKICSARDIIKYIPLKVLSQISSISVHSFTKLLDQHKLSFVMCPEVIC